MDKTFSTSTSRTPGMMLFGALLLTALLLAVAVLFYDTGSAAAGEMPVARTARVAPTPAPVITFPDGLIAEPLPNPGIVPLPTYPIVDR